MATRHRAHAIVVTVIAVVWAIGVLRASHLIHRHGVTVFVGDQWDFLTPLFRPATLLEMFRWQHGPHRMGLGLPMMVAVERWTLWDARAIGWMNLAVVAVTAWLGVLLKYRVTARLAPMDAALPVLFLSSSQWAVFVGVADTSHGPLPLLLIVVFGLLVTLDGSWWRTTALLTVDLFAVFTGFGMCLGFVAPILFLLEARDSGERVRASAACLVALLWLALFFVGYHSRPGPCLRVPEARDWTPLPVFMALMSARAFGVTRVESILTPLGALVLGVIGWIVASYWRRIPARAPEATWVLAASTFLFAGATALGRGCLGRHAAFSSRYVPYVVPGMLAAYMAASPSPAGRPARKTATTLPVLVALYVGLDAWPRSVDRRDVAAGEAGARAWMGCVVGGGDAVACQGDGGFYIHPKPRLTRLRDKVERMRREHVGPFS